MAVYVERKASWLEWIAPEYFLNERLMRIVTFFVFHSPCPSLSSMGRTLEEYGWHNPWRKPFYLSKQLKRAATNFDLLYSASTLDSLEDALKKANLSEGFSTADLSKECICFYDSNKNQFMSVFNHLRNAFAHCRLNMVEVDNECVFLLEDVCPKKQGSSLKLSARMVLRESTLLKWINIIEAGEKEYIRTEETNHT